MILSLSNGMLHMYIIRTTFIENGIFKISSFIKYVCHLKYEIPEFSQYLPIKSVPTKAIFALWHRS